MVKTGVLKNKIVRNILSALAVAGFGFILLNLAFIFNAIYQGAIRGIVELFIPLTPDTNIYWLPPLFHTSFVIIIGIISWFVFRSRIRVIYKAIYMTVPLAVVFVSLGMFLYHLPLIAYLLGSLFALGLLYYFYRTKQPWIYYYTLILISILMLIVGILGIEI